MCVCTCRTNICSPCRPGQNEACTCGNPNPTVPSRLSKPAVYDGSVSHCLLAQGDPNDKLVLELDDSFHRLQAHGLAEFHGLSSHSETSSTDADQRVTVIQHSSAESARQNKEQQGALQPGSCEITCADILMALEDRPVGGMNPAVLRRYMTGHTTDSDAASEDLTLI